MSAKRLVIIVTVAGGIVLPIVIGASCPPPQNPAFVNVISDNTGRVDAPVNSCTDGFVCVNLSNQASLPVVMALYVHDGFDPNDDFADPPMFECCTNPNSLVACPCPCPGREEGECLLNRNEIFLARNQTTVNGQATITLAPGQSLLAQRIRCGDIKTTGAAVALLPGDPVLAPADEAGPVYRDEPGGVPCGETVQFKAVDLNQAGAGEEGASEELATIILDVEFSNQQ